MSEIDMNRVLMELNRAASAARYEVPSVNQPAAEDAQSFSDLLKTAVDSVNEAQQNSVKLKKAFELGDPSVDLPQVMVASEKASVAFESMLEVRNKLIKAYQEIMSMQV